MKLYEEFKEYENLWEEISESTSEEKPADTRELWSKLPAVELEYDGFESDWYEDHFDPTSAYGHYTTGGTNSYDTFIYKVDAAWAAEVIEEELTEFTDKTTGNELIDTYSNLFKTYTDACEKANNDPAYREEEAAANKAVDLFLIENFDAFVEMFRDQLLEYFSEQAYDWAEENLEPSDI